MQGPVTGQSSFAAKAAAHERNMHVEVRGLEAERCGHAVFFTRRPPCSLAQTSMPPSVRGSTTVTCGSMKQWLTRGTPSAARQLDVCVLVSLVKLCAEGCIVFLGRCVIVRVEAELVAVANTSF